MLARSSLPRTLNGIGLRLVAWALCGLPSFIAAAPVEPLRPVQNMFEPLSTPAEGIHQIAFLTCAVCVLIFVVVAGLIAYATIRFRRKPGDIEQEPPQIYGSMQIELAWTVIPVIVVFALILVTARVVGQIQNAPIPKDALEIKIVGRQWWWEVQYPGHGVVTANEIHVPLSTADKRRLTHIKLESADVIHSFWVPQLAGKTDVVPGHPNETWIEPKAAGTYLGNCAEYCGTQHANMLIRVMVQTPEEFDQWIATQKAPPVADPSVAEGRDKFFSLNCVNCHAIGDTVATGVFGPDLTHLMSRETIGAGVAPLNHETLRRWIEDPQEMKVGCLMPDMQLSDKEVDSLTAFLTTLK